MRLHAWKSWSWVCAGLLALTVGCGGDDSSDGDAEAGNSESGTETGDPTAGDGDGDPTAGDGDGDPTAGDGDGDPTAGDGDGDPPFPECFALETQAECEADPNCQAVIGSHLKENGPDAPCLEPSEFMGCIGMQGCGDAETWFCVGGNNGLWMVPDTCGPEDGMVCDPPADPVAACP